MKKSKIPVLEIFGPTIQGEGMVVGRKTMFVRTAGCDYRCSWCDSAFTWDGSAKNDIRQMLPEAIFDELKVLGDNRFDHVTISGGNPALYPQMGNFISLLKEYEIEVALETQGSIWQDWFYDVDDLTISPKPPSSGMKTDFDKLDMIIENLRTRGLVETNVSLKVVIFDDEDLEYAKKVHSRYRDVPFYLQVGNQDLTTVDDTELRHTLITSYETLIDKVVDSSQLNDVRVLPQLHTLVWGNKRGV
ncbi:7-carboxy-7-deazaguanine synthase QueE [Salirhabdus salicampi]|uniref:7-carboxy-7-deazaguanine synthase QueE n=1 Tax=Salirhabdus salicampi TaxID=476102 RepID=UPI0020C3F5D0|nr:7-carboxy-7-deazaguanine synthase QueE [Salirhabdus salicampi]MCP8615950.1 7-carboxy-7-deazaguanine synthase QueE [Salirhabdus salicampi]